MMKTIRYIPAYWIFSMIRSVLCGLVLVLVVAGELMGQYRYGIKPVTLEQYRELVRLNPEKELVDLEKLIPGVVLDIRYATENNFTKQRIYNLPKAYARKPVAKALARVQEDLRGSGLGLKIFDAYRPYKATVKFYEVYKDTTYVASPYRGSRHNRGCAIDLTLIDLKSGKELAMPTEYDSFRKEAWPSTPVNDPVIRKNRATLIAAMQKHGFRVNSSEWWHFDFTGWKKYEILDIDFEDLLSQ
jgi:zinc D-Ala-D-Ala dipeptidase